MQSNMSAPLQVARRYWSMALVRGVIAIIFGLLAIFWPHLTFVLFMRIFGIFAIVEGIILLGSAFTQRTIRTSGTSYAWRAEPAAPTGKASTQEGEAAAREQFAYGEARPQPQTRRGTTSYTTHKANRVALMLEGILSIICGILALTLPAMIGALALYAVAAWALFKGIGALVQTGTRGWVLGVIGALGVILALFVFFRPFTIIHSLLWIIGVFALVMGVMLVLRGLLHNATTRTTRPMEPSY